LKEEVLPERPTRILILGDDSAVDYYLQRAKYHLLPHSAYVAHDLPKDLSESPPNYMIFFGQPENIAQFPGTTSKWQGYLTSVDRNGHGVVYHVGNSETLETQ
jgi:hypothetical protein